MDLNRQTSICTTAEMIEQTEKLKGNINVLNKELERIKEENRKLNFLVENYETANKERQ